MAKILSSRGIGLVLHFLVVHTQSSPFTTPGRPKCSSETPKQRNVRLYLRMSTTSIVTSKCLHMLHGLYTRCLCHSGCALVLRLQVDLPPKNAQSLALKLLNVGTLGCKKDERHLKCDFRVLAHSIWDV